MALTGVARIGENTSVAGEMVKTESDEKGNGHGVRAEARYQDEKLAVVALAAKTSTRFDNPGASFSAGHAEVSARAEYRVDPTLAVRSEALYSQDAAQVDARKGATMSVQKKLRDKTVAEVGLRHGQSNNALGSSSGFDYGQISTYNGQMGSSIGANSVTTLGAAAAAAGVDTQSQTTVCARLSTEVPGVGWANRPRSPAASSTSPTGSRPRACTKPAAGTTRTRACSAQDSASSSIRPGACWRAAS